MALVAQAPCVSAPHLKETSCVAEAALRSDEWLGSDSVR
jgi:hypothetical protein